MTTLERNTELTRNFKAWEFYSSEVKLIYSKETLVTHQIPFPETLFDTIQQTAVELQMIRDYLNYYYKHNKFKNKKGELVIIGDRKNPYSYQHTEIILPVNSGWRTFSLQLWLVKKKKSTAKKSQHNYGVAADIPTPIGMTPVEFMEFIVNTVPSDFKRIYVYRWGLHLDLKDTGKKEIEIHYL